MSIDFKACVFCTTYNQSKFIEETLDGFCIQKTNFPYVCFIIDDASTDGEQETIKNYLSNNFKAIDENSSSFEETSYAYTYFEKHIKNSNCYFYVVLLKENHYRQRKGKIQYVKHLRDNIPYEAYCEGDDYWIHPEKLQMQADILDSQPEIGLVYSKVHQFVQKSKYFAEDNGCETNYTGFLYRGANINLLSVMYRISIHNNYMHDIKDDKKWKLGDEPMFFYFIKYSKLHFIPEVTGTYRLVANSVSRNDNGLGKIDFNLEVMKCRRFYAHKYWEKTIRKDMLQQLFFYRQFSARDIVKFLYYTSNFASVIINKYYEYKISKSSEKLLR